VNHPRAVLLGPQAKQGLLPVCDHYSGVEVRMRKSLQLQAEMTQEWGTCVFDVTLDCEDGAPVGGEAEHAALVTELALQSAPSPSPSPSINSAPSDHSAARMVPRVAVRVHPVDHPSFDADMATIVGQAGHRLCHVMVPKVESVADVERAAAAVRWAGHPDLPLHCLIESPGAVQQAFAIAAHPQVQSLSFGLMDFVSAHGGAIPGSAMTSAGQFSHPLVLRAKLEITSAAHAAGKVPSHCVVTEFKDASALQVLARRAATELGFTRMWSIHPDQIRPILAAFAPDEAEIEKAADIILAAQASEWAPISHAGQLHDRASYRYFWQVLERAHGTGRRLPKEVKVFFDPAASPLEVLA